MSKVSDDKGVIEIQERGWPGHYICCYECLFRRNTLVSNTKTGQQAVVSTVGARKSQGKFITVGAGRYYETMAFMGREVDGYVDADVSLEITLQGRWSLSRLEQDSDLKADAMHDRVVSEVANWLLHEKLVVHEGDVVLLRGMLIGGQG